MSEVARLRRWKAEAIEVLAGWELVYEAVDHRPADLGRSKSDVVLDRIAAKDAEIQRLRDGIAEHRERSDLLTMENEELWALIEDGDQ